jgi:hypothetical protein
MNTVYALGLPARYVPETDLSDVSIGQQALKLEQFITLDDRIVLAAHLGLPGLLKLEGIIRCDEDEYADRVQSKLRMPTGWGLPARAAYAVRTAAVSQPHEVAKILQGIAGLFIGAPSGPT